jgi:RNA polymerase sigma-70 factor (ECF subfamily)
VPTWQWEPARQRCLREARRILGNRDDAEEVVQEALVRAWRKRHALRNPAASLPWMLQITRNEAMRFAAQRQRRRASEVPEAEPAPGREARVANHPLDDALMTLATEQALRSLRPDERRLIRLRYMEDLTQGQVAEALGVPEGTVKVRLHRARARLRGAAAELAA